MESFNRKRETVIPEYGLPFRRALLKGVGFDDDQLRRPLVGGKHLLCLL